MSKQAPSPGLGHADKQEWLNKGRGGSALDLRFKDGVSIEWLRRLLSRKEKMRRGIKNQFLDTNLSWIIFTVSLSIVALTVHLIAEFVLHIYDVTQIDTFTHWLSGMTVGAIILNFNLSRSRKIYYAVAIASAYVFYILWEIAEGL